MSLLPSRFALAFALAAGLCLGACERPVSTSSQSAAGSDAVNGEGESDGAASRNAAATASDTAAAPALASNATVATASSAASELGAFRIVSVLLGTTLDADHVVRNDTAVFAPGDPVHASVLTSGAHQGLRMSATWHGAEGTVIAVTEKPMVPTAASVVTFSLVHAKPWPAGDYAVHIAINGRAVQERKFTVR